MLKKIWQSISWVEWRFVILIALAMVVITTVPVVFGYFVTPPQSVFTAVHFAAPNDWFVYYSYIEQVRDGHWLFTDLFASEPHLPVLNIFWLAVGLLARVSGMSAPLTFQVARVVLLAAFYFVVYVLLASVFRERRQRQLALVLLSCSSGLGLLLVSRIIEYPFNFAAGQFNWPMDLWVPEAFTFLTLYYSPHFIASLTLIVSIFLFTIWYEQQPRWQYAVTAGVLAGILFEFHPFHILTIFGVLFGYTAVQSLIIKRIHWPLARFMSIVLLLSAPSIGYYVYLLQFDWVTTQKAVQNITWTTPLWITLFSYGLLLLFAAIGVGAAKKQIKNSPLLFVLVWLAVQAIVMYAPVNYQRRMTEGWHVPLVIFSTIGIIYIWHRWALQQTFWQQRLFAWRYTIAAVLGALLIGSNVFQLATDYFIYSSHREMTYSSTDLVLAASWLRPFGQHGVVFNTANNIINELPAYCDCTVYVGHGVETPYFSRKQFEVDWFFQRNRDQGREQQFLQERHIKYLLFGPSERALGSYDPNNKPYLRSVYTNSTVTIYQVL